MTYIEYFLILVVVYIFIEKLLSNYETKVDKIQEAYLLCRRVDDLENDMAIVKQFVSDIADQYGK